MLAMSEEYWLLPTFSFTRSLVWFTNNVVLMTMAAGLAQGDFDGKWARECQKMGGQEDGARDQTAAKLMGVK